MTSQDHLCAFGSTNVFFLIFGINLRDNPYLLSASLSHPLARIIYASDLRSTVVVGFFLTLKRREFGITYLGRVHDRKMGIRLESGFSPRFYFSPVSRCLLSRP